MLTDSSLDSTTALLNSSNYFPSRLQIPHASLTHFPSLFRRLSRIFSHAYFHHREAFATSEAETSLYARFAALCQRYELLGAGLLLIPPEGYEVMTPNDDSDDHNDKYDSSDEEPESAHADTDAGNTTSVLDEPASNAATTHENANASGASPSPAAPVPGNEGSDADKTASAPIEVPAPAESERKDDSKGVAGGRGSFSPNRWSGSPVQPPHKGKPAPAQASESLSPPSTRAALDALNDSPKVEPKIESKVVSGKGRGTLSRGKAPRASVFAATGPDANASGTFSTSPTSTESVLSPSVLGMARKESVESAVFVGDEEKPQHEAADTATDTSEAVADAPDTHEETPANDVSIPIQLDRAEEAVSPKTTTSTIPDILAEDTDASAAPTSPPKITKSELLPSPKSELLSISPKNTASPKRGGKSARGAPRSPKKTKGKALKKEGSGSGGSGGSNSPVPTEE